MARTLREKVIDRLLSLYIIDKCQREYNIPSMSETKMQKLVFLAEKKLIDYRCKGLNYRFIKLLYPTYSQELEDDLKNLAQLRFLEGPYYSGNQRTQMILGDFCQVLEKNREIKHSIDSTLENYASVPTGQLVHAVRRMRWRKGSIGELAVRTPLLYPLKEAIARCIFEISDEDLEDLAICLSPRISKGMEQAFDELRRGQRLTHAQVFG